jgi:metal transporter CNNM
MSTSGDEQERKDAAKVMKLLGKGRHWVLVVLLLSNVVVNESLPIFLDSVLGGGVGAVVLSTTLIVIFGEIIPQCAFPFLPSSSPTATCALQSASIT